MSGPEKLCARCDKPLPSRRLKYHPECSELERERMRCGKCKKIKPASKFSSDKTRANGKFPYCMECQVAYSFEHRLQDPDGELTGKLCLLCDTPLRGLATRVYCSAKCKERCSSLRRNYGLTPQQYRALVAETGGRCPICKRKPSGWHVDHNHKTGKATGVVCGPCNVGALASTNHDIEMVQRLLAYLQETPTEKLGIDAVGTAKTPKSNLHTRWRYTGPKRPKPEPPPF